MTKTLTLFLCGCIPVEELVSNPFDVGSHVSDMSEGPCRETCRECGDCKLEPKQIKLTLSVEEI